MHLCYRWTFARIAATWFLAGLALRLLLWIADPSTYGLSPDCRFMPDRLWCEVGQGVWVARVWLDLPLGFPRLPLVSFVIWHNCVLGSHTRGSFDLGDLVILGANSTFWAGVLTVGLWLLSRFDRTQSWFGRGPLRRLVAPSNAQAVAMGATRPFLLIAIGWFLVSGALYATQYRLSIDRPYDDALLRATERAADRALWPLGSTQGLDQLVYGPLFYEAPGGRPCGAHSAATVIAANSILWAATITATIVAVRRSGFLSRHKPPPRPPASGSVPSR